MEILSKPVKPVFIRKPGYGNLMIVCFLLGVTAGTVLVNVLYPDISDQAGYFTELMSRSKYLSFSEQRELFFWALKQRMFEVLFAWLVGMTVFSVPCYYVISAFLGLSSGAVLSMATCQKGLMGLPYYILTLFPHYLIYALIFLALAKWGGEERSKLRLFSLGALAILTLLGAVLEAFVNPWITKLFLR